MEKSESIKNLAIALCEFQANMGSITKDSQNPFFKSKYASLSAIIEDTREPLAKCGLSYAQFPTGESELTTVLMHISGEFMIQSFKMTPVDQKPQSVGSAITYARRYALCSVLGLQVDDDDGNEASRPKQEKKMWKVIQTQEPVEDDVKVTVTSADTSEMQVAELADAAADEDQIPEDVTDQKKVIMSFVKILEPKTDMRSAKAIGQVVADITQTALTPKNYKFIIGCLREEIAMRDQA